jgi:hypothetical protein
VRRKRFSKQKGATIMKRKFIERVPEDRQEELKQRVKELREYYGLSWMRIPRIIEAEFGILVSHVTLMKYFEK